jgi:hypothetical protein
MDIYTATEVAYQNGYEKGQKDMAKKYTGRLIKIMYETGDFSLYQKIKDAANEFGADWEEVK